MDSTTRNRYLIIGVAVCILISIISLLAYNYRRNRKKLKKKQNKGMLWLNEDKSMLEPHVFDTALDDLATRSPSMKKRKNMVCHIQ